MAEEKKAGERAVAVGLVGGATAAGIIKLIDALTKKAAPPPGVVIFTPDEQTKEAIAAILALLTDISVKLNALDKLDLTNTLLADIKSILSGEPILAEAQYRFRFTDTEESLLIAGNSEKQLYETTAPDKGALLRIKLVSDSANIRYDLYIDNHRWQFNVSDMVDQSIETPHAPGAWLDKATGTEFVFMFSGGESMLMRYWDNFRLVARTTTATAVTIASGEVVEKVLV